MRVPHVNGFLDVIDRYISEKYPKGLESLMVELPTNWPEFSKRGFTTGLFDELAKRYEQKGTRIIYGDRARKTKPSSLGILLDMLGLGYAIVDAFIMHKRDKGMIQAIKEENPEIVVVGIVHANYIKQQFPDEKYVAFEIPFRKIKNPIDALAYLASILTLEYKLTNQIVNL